MFKSFLNILYFFTFLFPLVSFAQDSTLNNIQRKLDEQKNARVNLVYSFNTVSYVHKLDKHGGIEKTDTIKTWQKFKGDSLQEYALLYSSDKKEERNGGKKGHRASAQLPRLDDPAYDFLVDQTVGKITFNPKKPKKGNLAGELLYDPQSLTLIQINAAMSKHKWPVNEFSLKTEFVLVEEFLFPSKLWMQAGWNALISRGRIRVESSNTDYNIYK
ncbi:hypothetical protein HY768_10780 [candidate division TA06 bacterium]|uniref:MucB/RseB N-terminal domain-containing protein n=1 Tax=candidate division TA06 bacterium TaxID=2250710 RepID=A0A933MJ06_UNCT6|nr:hypothetical protein [candidate division TA06 bacterium]